MNNPKNLINSSTEKPRPIEIKYKKSNKTVYINFDNEKNFELSAEYLRVESPSAEVQGHNSDQKIIVAGKKFISINNIEKVGNYAIRIVFNDGQDTGRYSWVYLYNLGMNKKTIWKKYLKSIEVKRLSRELG